MYITKNNSLIVPPGDHIVLEAAMQNIYLYKIRNNNSLSFKDQESVFTVIEKMLQDYQK